MLEVPDFRAAHSAVEPVAELHDASALTMAELRRRFSDRPVIMRGAADRIAARTTWTNEFFQQFARDRVTAVLSGPVVARLSGWRCEIPLGEFMRIVETMPTAYLSEWYFFRQHPEHLRDITDGLPPVLLDDWLDLIPRGWGLSPDVRNNIYWGADGSRTACHWDNLGAQTWNITLRGTKRWLLFDSRKVGVSDHGALAARLRPAGIMSAKGFLSGEGIAQWIDRGVEGLGTPTFWTGEVEPGDLIYVPPRCAHQVHNIGECLAVSRYYVNELNFEALIEDVTQIAGSSIAALLRGVLGSPRRRALLGSKAVQAALSSKIGRGAFHAVLRHTPLYVPVPNLV